MIDLERVAHRNNWTESYFDEIAQVLGPSKSKGAYRILGDFEFFYDAMPDGWVGLFVVTKSNMVQLDRAIRVKWDEIAPARAAEAMLLKLREIQTHPMYVVSKRSEPH